MPAYLAGRPASRFSASWSPRARINATASSLSASEASSEFRMTAARASVSACFTRGSVSFSSAASSAGSALSSRDLNTACAPANRRPGSARHQRQAAERRIDAAAEAVVDVDARRDRPARRRDRLAGLGGEQLAGCILVVDRLLLGAEEQPLVPQRLDDGRGARIAAGGHLGDAGVGRVEVVFEKIVEQPGKPSRAALGFGVPCAGPARSARELRLRRRGCAGACAPGAVSSDSEGKKHATKRADTTRIAM